MGLVPVLTEGVVFAILALIWPEPQSAGADARARASVLAQLAGLALELAALKNELEQTGLRAEMTARAEGAEALHRVAAEVAGRRDPVGIAGDAVNALLEHYSADAGAFYVVDEEGRSHSLVCVGLPEPLVERVEAAYSHGKRQRFPETRSQVVMTDEGAGKIDLSGATLYDVEQKSLVQICDEFEEKVKKVRAREDPRAGRAADRRRLSAGRRGPRGRAGARARWRAARARRSASRNDRRRNDPRRRARSSRGDRDPRRRTWEGSTRRDDR